MVAYPPAPFIAPVSGSIEQRLQALAQALSQKANVTTEPAYNAVLLLAPGGGAWRLTVDDAGALTVAQVT